MRTHSLLDPTVKQICTVLPLFLSLTLWSPVCLAQWGAECARRSQQLWTQRCTSHPYTGMFTQFYSYFKDLFACLCLSMKLSVANTAHSSYVCTNIKKASSLLLHNVKVSPKPKVTIWPTKQRNWKSFLFSDAKSYIVFIVWLMKQNYSDLWTSGYLHLVNCIYCTFSYNFFPVLLHPRFVRWK